MKKMILTLSISLLSLTGFSQVPNSFQYQCSATDTADYTFTIHQGNVTGPVVYDTTLYSYEPVNGVLSIKLGSSAFDTIQWSSYEFYLEVQMNSVQMGWTQLVSVPYALYAKNSGVTLETDAISFVYYDTDAINGYYLFDFNVEEIISVGTARMYNDNTGNVIAMGLFATHTGSGSVSFTLTSGIPATGTGLTVKIPYLTTSGWKVHEKHFVQP